MATPEVGAVSARDAKALLHRGSALRQAIATFGAAPKQLREQVRSAFEQTREAMIRRELSGISVTRLNEVTSGGLRTSALQRAGYDTVAKVLNAQPRQLQGIAGIGAMTANQAVAAARQIADAVRSTLQFRIDLDPSDVLSSRLICALYRWDGFSGIAEALGQHLRAVATPLDEALVAATPTTSRLRMTFSFGKKRDAARTALAHVDRVVTWAENSQVGADIERAIALTKPDAIQAAVAWRDFEKRSVEYYGRLSEIVDLGLDVKAAEGFLPADIVDRINEQTLDDTFRNVSLRGYQAFGARFALVQRRVIIGDEMGLGKTIQAIAAMAHLRALDQQHFLVTCPASVVVNWTREIMARSKLRAYRIHGTDRETSLKSWIRDGGVGVTTIDSLHHVRLPSGLSLGMLVVDEAHYVKNPNTRRSQHVAGLANLVDRVLFLTGTPMENRVEEFKNLVNYLQPQAMAGIDVSHGAAGPEVFRRAVAPVYLRRNQEDVLRELPDLTRIDEWVEFGRADRDVYRAAVMEGNFMAMRRAAYMTGDPARSAKLTRLIELVRECAANGRKLVIFSFFRDVLTAVEQALGSGIVGPLTGSTPPTQRQAMIDRFSTVDGHAVLLSQIQAGGVGLNMQAASVAILCEPQIKPTTEEQAIARLHRMGQVRAVQVHRLLAADSADQRLLDLLATKSRLFDDYARRSDIAEASPDAIDISDAEIARKIVEMEQERLLVRTTETRNQM